MLDCWSNSYEYQRILEIMEDYWLSEPDEETVEINMYFRKADGQEQSKRIIWKNPSLRKSCAGFETIYPLKRLSDIIRPAKGAELF